MATSERTLKERFYHEMKEFLIIALYLWIIFELFIMYRSVILAENHLDFVRNGFAILNALALAKVMLVAKALKLGDRHFKESPLIYPTILKSALFSIVLAIFKILEEGAIGLYHGKSLEQTLSEHAGGSVKVILTLTLILFMVLIPFFGFYELERIVGEGKLARVFFRSHTALGQAQEAK